MNKKFLLSTMAACMLGTVPSFAAVEYWVSPNGDDANPGTEAEPFATPEMAVLSLAENEEAIIHLEKDAEFLIGSLNFGENKIVTVIGDNTTLLGDELPGNEGGEANRIVLGRAGSNMKFEGITFENGRVFDYFGGGAIFFDGESLEVENCRFIHNESGSGGSAILGRAGSVIIRNSYFDGNYAIGGGAQGAAVVQAGKFDDVNGAKGELIVENCTFANNNFTVGGQGTAISTYDNANNGKYSFTQKLVVTNCTFVNNTAGDTQYQAAIDITGGENCETYITNSTFYGGDGAFRLYFQNAPVYFVNNFAYVDKATILSEYTTDANLGQIQAYNNILYGGERGVNENILEPGLTTEAAACNNTIGTTSQVSMAALGVNTKLTTDDPDSKVPYLAILSQNSPLVDAGLDSYAEIDGEVENFIPATDVRGKASNGKKDIGAFEYNGLNAGVETITTGDNSNIAFISNSSEIVVTNSKGEDMEVAAYSVDGKLLYNAHGVNVTIGKDNLAKGLVIVKATDNNGSATKKIVVM